MKKNRRETHGKLRIVILSVLILTVVYLCVNHTYIAKKESIYTEKIEKVLRLERTEKEWIKSNQNSEGAIFLNDGRDVNPYFACIAAHGLLAGEVRESDLRAVRAYLDWHIERFLKENGTISNYRIADEKEILFEPDSQDSYIALFLFLLCKNAEITGEPLRYDERQAVQLGVKRMKELEWKGLTIAAEDKNYAYYMDNVEVQAALRALSQLDEEETGIPREKLKSRKKENLKAIATQLWNEEQMCWEVGVQQDGRVMNASNLSNVYPDGIVQIYGIAFDVYPSGKKVASQLYDRFCKKIKWQEMAFGDDCFFWSEIAYAASQIGDFARVEQYMWAYKARTSKSRAYPFHTATSGWLVKTCSQMRFYYTEKMRRGLLGDIIDSFKNRLCGSEYE